MKQPLQSQRFTLRLDPEMVDRMSLLMGQHPYRYQSHTDLMRQALTEYLAPRVEMAGEVPTPVLLPQKTRARLQQMMENGYGDANQIIIQAIRHYTQYLLEEEALFQDRFEAVEESAPQAPKVPEGLVQE